MNPIKLVESLLPRSRQWSLDPGKQMTALISGLFADGVAQDDAEEAAPVTAPVAAFSSAFPVNPSTAVFTDASTTTAGFEVVTWLWDFGDGTGSTVKNPSHTYAAEGGYTVSLTVTDSAGQQDSTSATLTIAGAVGFRAGVLSRNPVHYWTLSETSGTVATDLGTRGSDLTYGTDASTVGHLVPGAIGGNAHRFHGNTFALGLYSTDANAGRLTSLSSTFELAFKLNSVDSNETILIYKGQWRLAFLSGSTSTAGSLWFLIDTAGGNSEIYSNIFDTAVENVQGEWAYLSVCLNKTSNTLDVRLNNVVMQSYDITALPANYYAPTPTPSLYVSREDAPIIICPEDIELGDIQIYDYALTNQQRSDTYAAWLSQRTP